MQPTTRRLHWIAEDYCEDVGAYTASAAIWNAANQRQRMYDVLKAIVEASDAGEGESLSNAIESARKVLTGVAEGYAFDNGEIQVR